jgi:hypothetical protein
MLRERLQEVRGERDVSTEAPKPPPSPVAVYAYALPKLITAARAVGYALAVHGSMVRDLDLVAVPWVADARSPVELIAALAAVFDPTGKHIYGHTPPTVKPHGRLAFVIQLAGGPYLDVSVMPRSD